MKRLKPFQINRLHPFQRLRPQQSRLESFYSSYHDLHHQQKFPLPTETKVESRTSQSNNRTSINLSNSETTQGPSWGYLKSQFWRDLVDFWRYIPTKWLQERTKGSKNEPGMPPLRAFYGTLDAKLGSRACPRQTPKRLKPFKSELASLFIRFQNWIFLWISILVD